MPPVLAGWPRLHIKPSLTPYSQPKLPLALQGDGQSVGWSDHGCALLYLVPCCVFEIWQTSNFSTGPPASFSKLQRFGCEGALSSFCFNRPLHIGHYSLTLKRTPMLPTARRGRRLQFILVLDWLAWISAIFRCDPWEPLLLSWDILAYIPISFCRSFTQWIQFPCSLWLFLRRPLGLSSLKHLAF